MRGTDRDFFQAMTFERPKMAPATLALLGLIAFAVLAVRFSPNWIPFSRLVEESRVHVVGQDDGQAIEQAIFQGHSVNRGYHVLKQTRDLGMEITEPNHKIVRWRLLVPTVGHVLKLPDWAVLGLAQVGCVVLLVMLIAIATCRSAGSGRPSYEVLCFGLVAGASAPFFTSMGLLGYYDSWLAVALLAVGFAKRRWLVLLACVLAPWIDERFVIGFPLALCVRRIVDNEARLSRWAWLRRETLWPTVVVAVYALVRLKVGGAGGSQTTVQYLHEFVFSSTLTSSERAFGIWQGLRLGWVLVAVALMVAWSAVDRRLEAGLLVAGTIITGVIGALTALDTSRSMVMIMPLVPLGWSMAGQLAWWRRFHAPIGLAVVAILLPAWHCLGDHFQSVDNLWSGAWPEASARNNLGNLLARTPGRQDDAVAQYTEALRVKPRYAEAHANLALVLAGKPGMQDQALGHYTEALRLKPDYPEALYNLGNLFAVTPGRQESALSHYAQALRLKPDYVEAHVNRAILLANAGRSDDALRHYAEALKLRPEFGEVHNNLALLLATLPGRQDDALRHFAEAARLLPGNPRVHFNYARQLENVGNRKIDAVRHYMRALELNPNLTEARTALERLGQP